MRGHQLIGQPTRRCGAVRIGIGVGERGGLRDRDRGHVAVAAVGPPAAARGREAALRVVSKRLHEGRRGQLAAVRDVGADGRGHAQRAVGVAKALHERDLRTEGAVGADTGQAVVRVVLPLLLRLARRARVERRGDGLVGGVVAERAHGGQRRRPLRAVPRPRDAPFFVVQVDLPRREAERREATCADGQALAHEPSGHVIGGVGHAQSIVLAERPVRRVVARARRRWR